MIKKVKKLLSLRNRSCFNIIFSITSFSVLFLIETKICPCLKRNYNLNGKNATVGIFKC